MNAKLNQAHSNMLVQQVRPGEVLDSQVLDVMAQIPRESFVEADFAALAYADTALPIGYGQYMLTPIQEGRFLQALQLTADDEVLEIGTGCGYFTALLAKLAKHVTTVELHAELSQAAETRLAALNIDNVSYQVGDAAKSWQTADRVDAVVVTAAFAALPDAYRHLLKVGGRMLVVVGEAPSMKVQLIRRSSEWDWASQTLFETVIPPVINAEPKPKFQF